MKLHRLTFILIFSVILGSAQAAPLYWFDTVTGHYLETSNVNPFPVTPVAPSGASANQVQGTATDGAAAVGKPLPIAGVDTDGNIQTIFTDAAGIPIIGSGRTLVDAFPNYGAFVPYPGGVTASVAPTAVVLFGYNGTTLDRLRSTIANGLAVDVSRLQAGETHIGEVGGNHSVVSTTFARPADTTAYAALDTMSNSTSAPAVLTFTNVARISGGTGYVVKVRAYTDLSTFTARIRLNLFNAAPTAINDNSPFALLYANRAAAIGYIDLPSFATEGTGSDSARSVSADVRLEYATSGSRNLYAIPEVLDAATPASGQNLYFELDCENN
jgi:hypothetical protein